MGRGLQPPRSVWGGGAATCRASPCLPLPPPPPPSLQLHLKFCYEAVLLHAEQVLLRHGVGAPRATNSASPKVGAGGGGRGATAHPPGADWVPVPQLYIPPDPQDLVLGGDVPISSIQATIAKLSVRPAGEPAAGGWAPEPTPPPDTPPAPPEASTEPPTPSPPPAVPEPPGEAESSDGVTEPPEGEPAAPPAAPSSSSLELLASLTPEAFTLDASLKGKQRMNKQNFLQAQPGEGLRGPRPPDDPLSMLDPLWTLNKT